MVVVAGYAPVVVAAQPQVAGHVLVVDGVSAAVVVGCALVGGARVVGRAWVAAVSVATAGGSPAGGLQGFADVQSVG